MNTTGKTALFISNLYVFFLIIYSGLGIEFFRENAAIVLLFFVSLAVFVLYKFKSISKKLLIIISIWILYSVLNTISVRSIHPFIFIYYPIFFFSAYVAIKIYNEKIVFKIETIIFYLAVISLFFFMWHLLNQSSFFSFAKLVNVNPPLADESNGIKYNFIIYNVKHMNHWLLPRNCGYCWEPGPFGCFLVMAIYFNQIKTNFSIKNNFRFWILVIALLTTQSTTAFIAFFIVIFWILFNKRVINRLLYILIPVVLVVVIILFIKIPFLQEKIIDEFVQINDMDQLIDLSLQVSEGENYAPGRFASFLITWQDFVSRPIFGYGGDLSLRWTDRMGAAILPVTGIGNNLAQYGILVFFGWLLLLYKSSKTMSDIIQYKIKSFWIVLVLVISIAFSIVFSPVFFIIYLMPYFVSTKEDEPYLSNSLNS